MKTTFFYLATLAASAFAAPTVNVVARPVGVIDDAVNIVDDVVANDLSVGQVVDGIVSKREIVSSGELIQLLTGAIKTVKGQTGAINGTLAKVQDGTLNEDDASNNVSKQLQDMHFKLTEVLTKVLGSTGLSVVDGDVDKVLDLVVVLVSEVLCTVKLLLTILGLRSQIASLLHSVFSIVAGLLKVLIGLVTGLLPGLVAALSPLLAGIGSGLLAPLLTPVVGLLAGLSLTGQ
ncbi:hypothetical protein QQS21_007963 [Conoideocrella luteorostrata]|uniref:Uncharacterized protein n=1 Tax=Conoideocrella luteorostrata TaxID=1105319 RepID=A0AAJ0CM29_9HYPO|nr:hypothetical protein QQS21_007963 [Conoideocrella luteorostrata]